MEKQPVWMSRRFISAVVGVVVMIIVNYVPEFQGKESVLVDNITYVVMALIAGYSVQDAIREATHLIEYLRAKAIEVITTPIEK